MKLIFNIGNVGEDENNYSKINISIIDNQLYLFGITPTNPFKTIRLIEPSAKLLKQWNYEVNNTYTVSQLSRGIYFVQVELNLGIITRKVLK